MEPNLPHQFGRFLILIGLFLVVVGLIVMNKVHIPWLGHLPGDIRIERENFRFYFPIATSVVISVVLSLLFAILRK